MKTNPLTIFAGLAIAALALFLGLTRDRWYGADPEVTPAPVAGLQEKTEPETEVPPIKTEDDNAGAPDASGPEMQAAVKTEPPKVEGNSAETVTPPKPEEPAVQTDLPKAEPPKVEETAEVAVPPKPEDSAVQAEPPKAEPPKAGDVAEVETPPQPEVTPPEPVVTTIDPPKVEEPADAAALPKPEDPAALTAVNKTEPPKLEEKTTVEALPEPEESVAGLPKTDPPKIEDRMAVVEEPPLVEEPPQQTETEKSALPKLEGETSANPESGDAPGFDTVRVEKTGEAVIAGRAEAGSEVTVKHNGKAIGTAVANSSGAFVVVPDAPLPPGNGALTLEAKSSGDISAKIASETVAVAVPEKKGGDAMVAVVSPDQPTRVLQKPEAQPEPKKVTPGEVQSAAVEPAAEQPVAETPSKPAAPAAGRDGNISLDAVDYDTDGNIVFSGRGSNGSAIRLYVDNQSVGETRADADGRWSFAGAARIAPGTHRLRVDELAEGGGVASRVELPFFREAAAKVALATPEPQAPAVAPEAELTAPAPSPETQAALTQAPAIEAPLNGRIVIQPGNNLWKLSRVIYGKGVKYTVIYEANKDHIRNPNLIYPGQVFMTPDAVPPETIDPVRREPLTPEEGGATAQ